MGDLRSEKLNFRRKDIVSLGDLPSSQVADRLVVKCPPVRRSIVRRVLRFYGGLFLLIGLLVAAAVSALESGMLDRSLSSGAQSALNAAMAPDFRVSIGSSATRFSGNLHLAVEARDVAVTNVTSGEEVSRTEILRIMLDPVSLLSGQVSISQIEADGIALDSSLLSSGNAPIDLSKLRIDAIPGTLEQGFSWLDQAASFMRRSGTDSLKLNRVAVGLVAQDGSPKPLTVDDLQLMRSSAQGLALSGVVSFAGNDTEFRVDADHVGEKTQALSATFDSIELSPFMLRRDKAGEIRQGYAGAASLNIRARRALNGAAPGISASISSRDGMFYFDAVPQAVGRADIALAYDFSKDTIELMPSEIEFGPMRVPFSGGLIDLDRLERGGKSGFGIDFLVNDAWADAPAAGEAPFPFSLKLFGRYLHEEKLIDVTELTAQTPSGNLNGKLRVSMANPSPDIRFNAQIPQMQTGMVKQLWPYWMAAKPRQWVFANLFGGTIRNGSIDVHIPSGRLTVEPHPLELRGDELRVEFDIENARMNIAGDIPPVRDTSGHLLLQGETLAVNVTGGTSYFGSNRSVKVESAQIGIASTYTKPLMADISVAVSGEAAAVGELVSYQPINALQRTGFSAEDLSGHVKAKVDLRLGLIRSQHPPDPDWKAEVQLNDVALAREFDGRKVSALSGTLSIDPAAARLEGKGEVDGMPMEVTLTEPIEKGSPVARERLVKLKLDDADRNRLVPGLEGVIDGPIELELTRIDEKRQAVVTDLSRASLTVPWVGWSKGKGVAAKTQFEMKDIDGVTHVDNFSLKGDGFGADGRFVVNKAGLVSADLPRVQLSPADDFALSLNQNKGNYQISLSGKSADLRSIFGKLKSSGDGGKSQSSKFTGKIDAKLERAVGFHDETLSNLSLRYVSRGGKVSAVDLSAVTDSKQAVVAQMRGEGGDSTLSLTSSDAGAVARFADIYRHMQGGLVNLKLNGTNNGPWVGSIDVRNFRIDNEERLQSIVSTPADPSGRSLNKAVKRDIDVSSAKFQRGFARLVYHDEALRIDNGVVRGEQVGATFQGMLRDAAGNMDMTGTFMPAYGLNRLFAELPVIGVLLGNGRDRGLLGITFKLVGPTDKPKLSINPLSLIAPGVFRQIFEFQ
ncbi:DUF3971 domain-containing protein [Rhizobium sp. RU36D]|uniref:YhdP family protein n=1 Tax=Rhizobium sp. RU36D TaxID=1907415 RepID=UPI0009D8CC82|nr:DUF3971 domain-containing protein [Rhizobium sp. RU36D]SMC81784.1 AsmA-like C-terminal region [Rhizobium sp. RU36D]